MTLLNNHGINLAFYLLTFMFGLGASSYFTNVITRAVKEVWETSSTESGSVTQSANH
jgi:hypothetical protein